MILYHYDSSMAEAKMREKLENRIRRCYDQQSLLSAQERLHWFSTTLEDRLQEDAKRAVSWLQGIERLIKISRREQKQRPKESIILENFLKGKIIQIERPNQATAKPQAFIHELNPD
jgi:hypothetical protein